MNENTMCGVGYHPNFFSKEDWKKDLENMQKAGITLLRTAELFNGWDQIEIEEGVYDFSILDDFFDLCHVYGIQIILGTGTASIPQWLKKKYDLAICDNHGRAYPHDASYSWACPHNPNYERHWKQYLKTLILHFKSHPALFAYQIHNEVGFPFMSNEGKVESYCHCKYTEKEFIKWVQKKYNTLENLNNHWTWSTNNPVYTDFSQVEIPSSKPTAWASVTRWLDFRLFMMDTIALFIKKQNDFIKKYDTKHITTVNTFFMKGEDKLGVMCGLHPFSFSDCVDIVGFDLYPGSSNKLESKREFSSMFLDLCRSSTHDKYWMLEVESGPLNGWVLGPHRNTNDLDIIRNAVTCLGHNAKMQLYMGYREWCFQPINWGGLVDLKGNPTNRLDALSKVNEWIRQYQLQDPTLHSLKSKIGIVFSRRSNILSKGFDCDGFMIDTLRAYYTSLWKLDYQIDFIDEDHLDNLKQYQMIFLPFLISCSDSMMIQFQNYVQEGGILYAEPRVSYLNEYGWYHVGRPAALLQDIFGIQEESIEVDEDVDTKSGIYGYWHRDHIKLYGAKVLDDFEDGSPALTCNSYGKGFAVFGCSYYMLGNLRNNKSNWLKWLQSFMESHFIKPTVKLTYSKKMDKIIEADILQDESRQVLFITNYANKKQSFDNELCQFTICTNKVVKSIKEITTNDSVVFTQEKNNLRFSYNIERDISYIFEIKY